VVARHRVDLQIVVGINKMKLVFDDVGEIEKGIVSKF